MEGFLSNHFRPCGNQILEVGIRSMYQKLLARSGIMVSKYVELITFKQPVEFDARQAMQVYRAVALYNLISCPQFERVLIEGF
jgi:hypothetical protein